MKTISIKQLHAETGRWVRMAKTQTLVVTDRGERIATLRPHTEEEAPPAVFILKERGVRPKVPVDSTLYISEDRDGR